MFDCHCERLDLVQMAEVRTEHVVRTTVTRGSGHFTDMMARASCGVAGNDINDDDMMIVLLQVLVMHTVIIL